MSDVMAVILNGIAQLEYHRDRSLPDHQAAYLERMDVKMEAGIVLGEEVVEHPSLEQRAQFVAANLFNAIRADDADVAAAMCSWLAVRLPELKQVRIDDRGEGVAIEFDYDNAYLNQVAVSFPLQ